MFSLYVNLQFNLLRKVKFIISFYFLKILFNKINITKETLWSSLDIKVCFVLYIHFLM